MAMRSRSSWAGRPTRAHAREHASTYYCMPSYCTVVLPPGLPRRQDLLWEGACKYAYGSAGLPRSPWCSHPKLTTDSNHLGKIQKSPVSFIESPAPSKPRKHWLVPPAMYPLPSLKTGMSLNVVGLDVTVQPRKSRDRREREKYCFFIDFNYFLSLNRDLPGKYALFLTSPALTVLAAAKRFPPLRRPSAHFVAYWLQTPEGLAKNTSRYTPNIHEGVSPPSSPVQI